MLSIDVTKIPPEGLDILEPLTPGDVKVPEGEDFVLAGGGSLRCHVELGDEETVHVKGHLVAGLELACGRCLEPFGLDLDQDLELFCLPHRADQEEEDEVEVTEREMVVAYYSGHTVDLGEMVREQIYLAVPMKRLCRADCQGLCPRCGTNKNRESCSCPAIDADPRLASLGPLLGR